MKQISAIVKASRITRLRDALREIPDFPGMTVDRIEGFSRAEPEEGAKTDIRRELTDFSPGLRLSVVAPDELVPEIVRRIREVAYTGQKGDGVLWVTTVEQFLRLREDPNEP